MRCKIVWNICELGKGWSNKCANWPDIYSMSLVADCWLKSGKGLIRRVSHYLQEVSQPPIQNLPSWHAKLFGYWLAVCYTRFTKRTWNPPKLVIFPIPKAFFSGEDLKMGKLKHEIALMFEKKAIVPSRQLTYPIPRHFWRWFSFSQGGICYSSSQEGKACKDLFKKHGSPVLLRAHIGRHFSVSFPYWECF